MQAIRRSREIMQAPGFRPFTDGELYPGRDKQSDAELADYARQSAITTYHPVGSCRMGVDALAVVDPRLRVRGIDGRGGGLVDHAAHHERQHPGPVGNDRGDGSRDDPWHTGGG